MSFRFLKSIQLTLYSNPAEYMAIEDTYSPVIHRISQAIRRRAVKLDEAVAPPPDILIKWSHPPSELVNKSSNMLEKLIKTADVKKGTICPPITLAITHLIISQFPPQPNSNAIEKSPSPSQVSTYKPSLVAKSVKKSP